MPELHIGINISKAQKSLQTLKTEIKNVSDANISAIKQVEKSFDACFEKMSNQIKDFESAFNKMNLNVNIENPNNSGYSNNSYHATGYSRIGATPQTAMGGDGSHVDMINDYKKRSDLLKQQTKLLKENNFVQDALVSLIKEEAKYEAEKIRIKKNAKGSGGIFDLQQEARMEEARENYIAKTIELERLYKSKDEKGYGRADLFAKNYKRDVKVFNDVAGSDDGLEILVKRKINELKIEKLAKDSFGTKESTSSFDMSETNSLLSEIKTKIFAIIDKKDTQGGASNNTPESTKIEDYLFDIKISNRDIDNGISGLENISNLILMEIRDLSIIKKDQEAIDEKSFLGDISEIKNILNKDLGMVIGNTNQLPSDFDYIKSVLKNIYTRLKNPSSSNDYTLGKKKSIDNQIESILDRNKKSISNIKGFEKSDFVKKDGILSDDKIASEYVKLNRLTFETNKDFLNGIKPLISALTKKISEMDGSDFDKELKRTNDRVKLLLKQQAPYEYAKHYEKTGSGSFSHLPKKIDSEKLYSELNNDPDYKTRASVTAGVNNIYTDLEGLYTRTARLTVNEIIRSLDIEGYGERPLSDDNAKDDLGLSDTILKSIDTNIGIIKDRVVTKGSGIEKNDDFKNIQNNLYSIKQDASFIQDSVNKIYFYSNYMADSLNSIENAIKKTDIKQVKQTADDIFLKI